MCYFTKLGKKLEFEKKTIKKNNMLLYKLGKKLEF